MIGFFKRWAANTSEYKRLQKELTEVYSQVGVNFMHLHPEITKYLVNVARDEGASGALTKLSAKTDMIRDKFPELTQDESKEELIRTLTEINKTNRGWE
jgi:hypothetical protein